VLWRLSTRQRVAFSRYGIGTLNATIDARRRVDGSNVTEKMDLSDSFCCLQKLQIE